MLDARMIRRLFKALDAELAKKNVLGEVGLCGGAVMCLVFNARAATKDVDGIFAPAAEIREAVRAVGKRMGVDGDWLNDAAKGFFYTDPPKIEVFSLPHLRVWAPPAEYMLAMKCVSARFDSMDRRDVEFLIRRLGFTRPREVFAAVEAYCPRGDIPAKARFLIEEILPRD